jgi:hypothetical protein
LEQGRRVEKTAATVVTLWTRSWASYVKHRFAR